MNHSSRRTESIAYATPSRLTWSPWSILGRGPKRYARRNTDFEAPDSPHPLVHPSQWQSRRLQALLRSRPVLALALLAAGAYVFAQRASFVELVGPSAEQVEQHQQPDHLICNPYDAPGYFSWQESDPYQGKWRPLQDVAHGGCPEAPDWLEGLRVVIEDLGQRPPPPPEPPEPDPHYDMRERWRVQDEMTEALSWMRNRTILVVGDSVDRNAMDHLGHLAWSQVYPTDYHDATFVGKPEGWDVRGVPHVVNMPRLNSQVVSVFFYGTDDEDVFQWQADWHAPGKAEDRLSELFVPFTAQLKHPPDFIQLHSGMWDLAFFGRKAAASGESTALPISQERVEWWQRRMRSIISQFRQAYPGVPMWLRVIHRVGTQLGRGTEDYVRGIEGHFEPGRVNFFTDMRCNQLREMQKAIAHELCLPINDFGRWWEGLQPYQDKVHPHPLPGGLVYLNPLLHSVWMESQGRENWEVKPCATGYHVSKADKMETL